MALTPAAGRSNEHSGVNANHMPGDGVQDGSFRSHQVEWIWRESLAALQTLNCDCLVSLGEPESPAVGTVGKVGITEQTEQSNGDSHDTCTRQLSTHSKAVRGVINSPLMMNVQRQPGIPYRPFRFELKAVCRDPANMPPMA